MAKRALSLLLALAAVFSLAAPALAEEEAVVEPEEVVEDVAVEPETVADTSGKCGENVTWSFAGDTLTISGTGPMEDYDVSDYDDVPWYPYLDSIKRAVIGNSVTSIGEWAFSSCGSLTSVAIPESVTSIGWGAFEGCTSLTSVTIPESVTTIENCVFSGCTSLTSVTIPGSVTSIGVQAFCYSGLTSVTIPEGVTSIGEEAFAVCTSLTSVTIADTVTSIGMRAFNECMSLTNVTIPASVTSIGAMAFENCISLTSVTLQGGVTSMGEAAFIGAPLTSLTIQEGVTCIGESAFFYCTSLKNVTLPESLASIGRQAFGFCTSLNPQCAIAKPEKNDYGETLYTLGDPETTIICGHADSTAEWHARYYHYMFRSIDPGTELAAPTVTISQVADGIKVTWNEIIGAPRYMVYYRENGGSWKQIGTTTETTYIRKASALKNHVRYQFTVRCCDNDKKTMLSPYVGSNTLYYTVNLAVPTVTIGQASDGIKVSWNKITGSPRYMVYYKEGNGGWKKIGTTTATSYTRKAANLKNGVTYQFAVRCCDNDKTTMLSGYKASNSLKYTATLAAPTVKIEKVSTGIKVTWNKVTGAPRYMVYYKEGTGGWKKIGTTTATSYTRAAKYLKNGVTYAFTVRCCANDKKTLLGSYKASNSLKYTK